MPTRVLVSLLCGAVLLLGAAPGGAATAEPEGEVRGAVVERLAGGDRVATAVAVSQATHETASAAVLARADAFPDALAAAPLAAAVDGPVLLTAGDELSPGVAGELERLGVEQVLLLGGEGALSAELAAEVQTGEREVRRVAGADRYATAAAIAETVTGRATAGAGGAVGRAFAESGTVLVATGEDFPDALAAGPLAAVAGLPLLLATATEVPASTADALEELDPADVLVVGGDAVLGAEVAAALEAPGRTVRRLAGPTRYDTAAALADEAATAGLDPAQPWLATGADFPDALAAGPAVAAAGGTLLLVDGADLAAVGPTADRLVAQADGLERLVLLGGSAVIAADAVTQLERLLDPVQLPGGGRSILPERRVVAHYGSVAGQALGVLGEGTPDEAAAAVAARAVAYDTPERPALPAFEQIVTIAQRDPGADGDYSNPVDRAEVREYLEAARRVGAITILDFQPGQSDFLTQVREWEELLVEPDVSVALDPEWRMAPGQVPGSTIGSVDAAEVNAVGAYLSELVEREGLPQKLLVVHQFRESMIRDRDAIQSPPGLAVTFHIDGFGGREIKRQVYSRLYPPPGQYAGFKLFLDEDTDIFDPADTFTLEPAAPDLITYQ